MGIFDKRINYKPFEYPEVNVFIDAIDQTYWVANEIKWEGVKQEFSTKMSPYKQEVFKRATLSISQVEVAVKAFWGEIGNYLPKPEFFNLGACFANNERTHSDTYQRSLEELGLEREFEALLEVPAFKKKYDLITEGMSKDNKTFIERILFFTLVIENSSLFSHFAIALSFSRFDGSMKDLSNLIGYSSIDEEIHSQAGIFILNKIKEEGHDIFTYDVEAAVKEYIDIEREVLDWVFGGEDLVFINPQGKTTATLNTDILLNYLKDRLNTALDQVGYKKVFDIDKEQLKELNWFEEDTKANVLEDFFVKKVVDYTKHDKSITADDLF